MKTPLILLLITFIIRLIVILGWRFDGLYGQDPYAYLQQGLTIAQNLPHGQPPPDDFFWPNGYPLLIAFFSLVAGKTALAGQIAALCCGMLLSPLLYLLCRDLLAPPKHHQAGLLAGLIIAVSGQSILSSLVVMADMPALFWATLAAWCVVRALKSKQDNIPPAPHPFRSAALYFLAAGATLAMAIITRWIYMLILPALGAYTIFNLYHHKRFWWTPFPAIISGTIILAPQLWLTLNTPTGLLHSWLTGWQPINFFSRHFENIDGQFFYLLPVAIFYAQPAGHPAYIFPLLGVSSLWGLWQLWQHRQGGVIILLIGWIMPVYLFLAGIPYQNFRFGLTLYIPLVILTSFGLSELLIKFRHSRLPAPLRFRVTVALKALIILSLLTMLGWSYFMVDNFLSQQKHSKIIAQQVEASLPSEATLLTFGLTLTLQHYSQLNTLELFYFDETSLDTLTQEQNLLYLLLDLNNIQTQWQGKTPALNYQWLQTHTSLTKIGDFPPYSLFKLER